MTSARVSLSLAAGLLVVSLVAAATPLLDIETASAQDPPGGNSAEAEQPVAVDPIPMSRNSTTIESDSGTQITTISPVPINYRDTSGAWVPIDNSLQPMVGNVWAAKNEENRYSLRLPEDLGEDPVQISEAGNYINFRLRGGDGAPEIDGSEAVYREVRAADSIAYDANGEGVKETITLTASPIGLVRYVFDLAMSSGLAPSILASGEVVFEEASGKVVFSIAAPTMMDSTLPEPIYSDAASFELDHTSGSWSLTLAPSTEWLTDPARTYPVIVDPTVTLGPPVTDCTIVEGSASSAYCGPLNEYLRVGSGSENGSSRRGLLKFDVSSIPTPASIYGADLKLNLDATRTSLAGEAGYEVRPVSKAWTEQATWNSPNGTAASTWQGGGPWPNEVEDDTIVLNGSTSGWKVWDLVGPVRRWVQNDEPNHGVVLRQVAGTANSLLWFHSANSTDALKWPTLQVEYRLPGRVTSPASASAVMDATLACMQQQGEVPYDTTTEEALGKISPDGYRVEGTEPVNPSPSCSQGALNAFVAVASDGEPENTESRVQAWSVDVLNGARVAPTTDTGDVEEDHGFGFRGEPPASYDASTWIYYMNSKQDASGTLFIKYYGTPNWWDWRTDNCTGSPDSGPFFNFTWPCRRHDYGWKNLKLGESLFNRDLWTQKNKAVADNQFDEDTHSSCRTRYGSGIRRNICYEIADEYENAVHLYPPITTKDRDRRTLYVYRH